MPWFCFVVLSSVPCPGGHPLVLQKLSLRNSDLTEDMAEHQVWAAVEGTGIRCHKATSSHIKIVEGGGFYLLGFKWVKNNLEEGAKLGFCMFWLRPSFTLEWDILTGILTWSWDWGVSVRLAENEVCLWAKLSSSTPFVFALAFSAIYLLDILSHPHTDSCRLEAGEKPG